MNKLVGLSFALGSLILSIGAEVNSARVEDSEEPVYNGKSLSSWAKQLKDNDYRLRRNSTRELKTAVFAQVDKDDDWELARRAAPLFTEMLEDRDPEVRAHASEALYKFGLGPKAEAEVADLIKALKDKDPEVRWAAAYKLRFLLPAAKAAVPSLTKSLKDPDPSIRGVAALTLGLLGPEGKAAVPSLVEALKSEPDFIGLAVNFGRSSAAMSLGQIGPEAKAAVPALTGALRDKFPWVRAEAASALGQIGPAAKVALPDLRRALKDPDALTRTSAAISLWYLERRAKEPLLVLIETLQCIDHEGAWEVDPLRVKMAAKVIGEMGPEAKKAAPTLIPLLQERRWGIRREAVKALKNIDPDAAKKAGLD
jgi:HEAT repeat protein